MIVGNILSIKSSYYINFYPLGNINKLTNLVYLDAHCVRVKFNFKQLINIETLNYLYYYDNIDALTYLTKLKCLYISDIFSNDKIIKKLIQNGVDVKFQCCNWGYSN